MTEVPENWRELMEEYTSDETEIELLRNGPKSWIQAMRLQSLKGRYKDIMGIKDPEPVDCQSSFKKWNQSVGDK